MSRYPRLRVLCSVGAGADKLLVDDVPEHVAVTRVVDPWQAREIAQYVLACTLRFTRELPLYEQQQARAEWLRHPVRPAARCRVGVLGFGAVGQAIARAFAPLGYEVAGWARRARELPGVHVYGGPEGLQQLACYSIRPPFVGYVDVRDPRRFVRRRRRCPLRSRAAVRSA